MVAWHVAGAAVVVALALTAATRAEAQGTEAQRAACAPDAIRLCSDAIPDIGRVFACMKAKRASLSPQCRAIFPADASPASLRAAKKRDASPARRPTVAHQKLDGQNPQGNDAKRREAAARKAERSRLQEKADADGRGKRTRLARSQRGVPDADETFGIPRPPDSPRWACDVQGIAAPICGRSNGYLAPGRR